MWSSYCVVVLLTVLHLCKSDKCNINLEEVSKQYSEKGYGELLETEKGLSTIKDAYRIIINNQNIPVLCKNSVIDLERMFELNLASNGIEKIEPGAFSNIPRLADLHLNNNKLNAIQNGVFNKMGVAILRLDDNQIETINENAFDDMPKLAILKLSNNKIRNINKEWFKNTPSIRLLNLEHNLITKLEDNNFKNLHGKHVVLDDPAFLNIHLSDNKISSLSPKAFDGLEELGILWLDHNEISDLHEDTFRDLRRVQMVYLAFNKIACLPNHINNILKADRTSLENNPWNCTCLQSLEKQLKWRRMKKKVDIGTSVIKCTLDDMSAIVKDVLEKHQ